MFSNRILLFINERKEKEMYKLHESCANYEQQNDSDFNNSYLVYQEKQL